MKLLLSWAREFVDVTASPQLVADTMALRGFEVAAIEHIGDDAVIDFEITANRPDCLSVVGLAREIATAFDLPFHEPSQRVGALADVEIDANPDLVVRIEDAELCPRYAAAVADVSRGQSPGWMTSRLQASGVRPISPLVDITNYVLLELGHPMHAFDLDRLSGQEIRIRRAGAGERITTLDGVERTLEAGMLVIADSATPQAVAGVMGGGQSEVSDATRRVAFESAYFNPASVRRTGKRLGLKTEASARFERGADINAPVTALRRAIALLHHIGVGQISGPVIDVYPESRAARPLHLRRDRLSRVLGLTVPDVDVLRILRSLDLRPTLSDDGWDTKAPTYRVDLLREIDLIEEVGRHYGFDKLDAAFPVMRQAATAPDPRVARDTLVRRVLTSAGFSEAVTFGFMEAKAAEGFVVDGTTDDIVSIANPLSATFDVLRPSLLPGLLGAVAHNRRHGRRDVALFEIGARFRASQGETRGVAVAWTGAIGVEHWSAPTQDVDFFDAKGAVERLCQALGLSVTFEALPSASPASSPSPASATSQASTPSPGPNPVPASSTSKATATASAASPSSASAPASSTSSARALEPASEPAPASPFVPGQAARVCAGTQVVGVLGVVSPALVDRVGAPRQDRVVAAELNLDLLESLRSTRLTTVTPLPRYPLVVRDVSVVVSSALPVEIIRGTIQSAGHGQPAPLTAITFFDRYQGKGVPDGSVSVSIRLTFQAHDRTLTDSEVQTTFDTILAALVREHAAVQR